jgi:arsenite/tail-anchored protein-transporting ATPase
VRIIMFVGKGGVGKTTVSAATGLDLARRGYRTLVMSVDPAHSLSDCFDVAGRSPDRARGSVKSVAKNLWIEEIDVQRDVQRQWKSVYAYVAALLTEFGLEETFAEELAVLPGMEEASYLLRLNEHLAAKTFDVIVLDCAPTAESLRFVTIPSTLGWYIEVSVGSAMRARRRMLSTFTSVPVPKRDYFDNLRELQEGLAGIEAVLRNPKTTTVRLVTNPEKVVVRETQRAFTYFCLSGLTTDAVIANRIVPAEVDDDYFHSWKQSQARWMTNIAECFAPIPVFPMPLSPTELVGSKRLALTSETLYGGRDPVECFIHQAPYAFTRRGDVYEVRVRAPFVDADDVHLFKNADELIIRLGAVKRHVALPDRMAGCEPAGATLDNGVLVVALRKKGRAAGRVSAPQGQRAMSAAGRK